MSRPFNLVVAVCHPDDEALWVGGLLHELSGFDFIRLHVICLSGRDPASPRPAEFEDARQVAGYHAGVVLGFPLRPAEILLPPVAVTLEEGLKALDLPLDQVSLLLTHSPFGDELRANHHMQAFRELKAFAARKGVPFGFFSPIAIPWYAHVPFLFDLRRKDSFHLLNGFRCRHARAPWPWRWIDPAMQPYARSPAYYLQFASDFAVKKAMLDCYPSIGLEQHRNSYSAFTHACEGVYLFDDRAFAPFAAVIAAMPVPGHTMLFEQRSLLSRALEKWRRTRKDKA